MSVYRTIGPTLVYFYSQKKQKGIMETELIRRLLDEKWMPIVDSSVEDYGNVLAKLLRLLDDHNPMVYNGVIDYLIALFK